MDLIARDQKCIWHPFTQAKTAQEPLAIVRALGSKLFLADGRSLIDGIASWWCNIHGHCHPHITEAISEQAGRLDHVLFGGCTHPQAVRLAERLLQLLPYDRVFYSDNGSTAIEVALKMALQYRLQMGLKPGKIVALKGAYHGDTFGAMAAGRSPFHEPFWPLLFDVTFIDPPQKGATWDLEGAAIFIFEPYVQGASGMRMHDVEALDALIGFCRQQNVLTIADEVMTGFGRTGSLFVTDRLTNKPDFVCLSKGLTGGSLPLAVTLTSEKIFAGFYSDQWTHAFLHGHTFTANPIACAAANASLDLLLDDLGRFLIEKRFQELAEMLPGARAVGTIFAIDTEDKVAPAFLERGIFVRPIGKTLYLMPPYSLKPDELNHLCDTVLEVFDVCVL